MHVNHRTPTQKSRLVVAERIWKPQGQGTVIGKGAVVGANAWIRCSVPADGRVGGGA